MTLNPRTRRPRLKSNRMVRRKPARLVAPYAYASRYERTWQGRETLSVPHHRASEWSLSVAHDTIASNDGNNEGNQGTKEISTRSALPSSFLALLPSLLPDKKARTRTWRASSPRHFPGGDAEPKKFPPDRPAAAADGRGRARTEGERSRAMIKRCFIRNEIGSAPS